jgi:hypothetical protein
MKIDVACDSFINRELRADDIAGAPFLYGVAPIPESALPAIFGAGLIALLARRRWRACAVVSVR